MLGTPPAVLLAPLVEALVVVVVAAGVEVAGVAVVAGVEVVPVVPAPAVPAEWLVTNCVNAASNAVNRVLPPPWTPPPESESPSLSVLLVTLRVVPNKDDRLAAGLVPDTAFVVIIPALFEISRMNEVNRRSAGNL